MSTRIKGPEVLSTGHVARLFGVNPKTVIRWANMGRLRSFRTPGGHRRYHLADVEAFLQRGGSR